MSMQRSWTTEMIIRIEKCYQEDNVLCYMKHLVTRSIVVHIWCIALNQKEPFTFPVQNNCGKIRLLPKCLHWWWLICACIFKCLGQSKHLKRFYWKYFTINFLLVKYFIFENNLLQNKQSANEKYRFGFVKRINSDLYFNEKYRSGFVEEKIQICILMKIQTWFLLERKKDEEIGRASCRERVSPYV